MTCPFGQTRSVTWTGRVLASLACESGSPAPRATSPPPLGMTPVSPATTPAERSTGVGGMVCAGVPAAGAPGPIGRAAGDGSLAGGPAGGYAGGYTGGTVYPPVGG